MDPQTIHTLFNLLHHHLGQFANNVADELESEGRDSAVAGVVLTNIAKEVDKLHHDFAIVIEHVESTGA